MTASPWAPPQNGGQQSTPVLPPQAIPTRPQAGPPPAGHGLPPVAPPPRPPRRGLPWLIAGGAVALLIAAIAATAAITYAVARNTTTPSATPQPTVQAPQFSAAEQNTARQQLCHTFDVTARGQRGQGGMRVNGDVNVPVLLRTVNSVVAVQNALKPAVPQDLAQVAQRYIDTSLDVTSAATGNPPIEEVNRLTDVSNEATFAFADACGLQR